MSPWIIYSLIAIFYLLLLLVTLFFTREQTIPTQLQVQDKQPSHIDMASYSLLVGIFILIVALTILINRTSAHIKYMEQK